MGAVYSRITPSEAAEKPAGEWQTFDITLYKRYVTVILNGVKIIDNKPLLELQAVRFLLMSLSLAPYIFRGTTEQ